jgi:hypothetical protein
MVKTTSRRDRIRRDKFRARPMAESVKVFGCRPLANDATRFGGRRTKTSKGGNRGKGYVDGAARYTGACDRKSG